jgi:hypothetical protein
MPDYHKTWNKKMELQPGLRHHPADHAKSYPEKTDLVHNKKQVAVF